MLKLGVSTLSEYIKKRDELREQWKQTFEPNKKKLIEIRGKLMSKAIMRLMKRPAGSGEELYLFAKELFGEK